MQIRNALLAALATLPLLAGAASAQGNWGNGHGQLGGHGRSGGHEQTWRAGEARHNWASAERSQAWGWQRHRSWEPRRYEPPHRHPSGGYRPGGYHQGGGGWGPRW
jgi:hypothetical protein